ncbi:hypothetical protein FHT76_001504 [Rhizobium sp. BK176]|nr:hypothetical protein [Rhizobium sp. BK176]
MVYALGDHFQGTLKIGWISGKDPMSGRNKAATRQ